MSFKPGNKVLYKLNRFCHIFTLKKRYFDKNGLYWGTKQGWKIYNQKYIKKIEDLTELEKFIYNCQ